MIELTALADALREILNYEGDAENALADRRVWQQARDALSAADPSLRTLAAADEKMPVVAWLHLAPNSTAVVTTRPPAGFDPQDLADAEVALENLVRQSDAQAAVLAAYEAGKAANQAVVDRLMLEYCHDEMTAEQKANWAAHQRPRKGFDHVSPRSLTMTDATKIEPIGEWAPSALGNFLELRWREGYAARLGKVYDQAALDAAVLAAVLAAVAERDAEIERLRAELTARRTSGTASDRLHNLYKRLAEDRAKADQWTVAALEEADAENGRKQQEIERLRKDVERSPRDPWREGADVTLPYDYARCAGTTQAACQNCQRREPGHPTWQSYIATAFSRDGVCMYQIEYEQQRPSSNTAKADGA